MPKIRKPPAPLSAGKPPKRKNFGPKMFSLPRIDLKSCGFTQLREYTGPNARAIKKLGVHLIVADGTAAKKLSRLLNRLSFKRIASAGSIENFFTTELLARLKIKALLVREPKRSIVFLGDLLNMEKLPLVVRDLSPIPHAGERIRSAASSEEGRDLRGPLKKSHIKLK